MASVQKEFPALYTNRGTTKQHSKEYREFNKRWGYQKTLFDLAGESLAQVSAIQQQYLTTTLFWLTYLIDKGEVDEKEEQFQDNLRKIKGGR